MENKKNFLSLLKTSAEKIGNIACLGLDPIPEAMPFPDLPPADRVRKTFSILFKAVRKAGLVPAAFKPNLGFYHNLDKPRKHDFSGSLALAELFDTLEDFFPGIPIILDYKRGDIAGSSRNYAEEGFCRWGARAVTVSPYMGFDSVEPFLSLASQMNGGCYVLNRTSNPGAAEFQNLKITVPKTECCCGGDGDTGGSSEAVLDAFTRERFQGLPLYRAVSDRIAAWAQKYPGTGAVTGAVSLEELKDLASFYAGVGEIPLLIPGVGGQGGDAVSVINILRDAGYPLFLARINSASAVTHPWFKNGNNKPMPWVRDSSAKGGTGADKVFPAEVGQADGAPTDWLERSLKALEELIILAGL